jgi:hypothetical protein
MLGRFIAIHSAKKFDVKAPDKKKIVKNKKCNCCSIILMIPAKKAKCPVTLVVKVLQPELQ